MLTDSEGQKFILNIVKNVNNMHLYLSTEPSYTDPKLFIRIDLVVRTPIARDWSI